MSKILISYWSGTGNTEFMAEKIAEGIKSSKAEYDLYNLSESIPKDISNYDKFCFGCPAMGDEVLEESIFEPFLESITFLLKGKKVALFGSYGWGDGEWMRNWVKQLSDSGAIIFENKGLIVNGYPDEDDVENCINFGTNFVKF